MYLSWAVALCSTPLLFTSGYWNTHQQSALAFIVLLASIPILFGSLVSGIHEVRRIELERARLEAMREVAVARSTFLSKVSHELRSPLQGIVSALDLMEMRHGSLQSEDRELVSRMRRSSLLLNTQLRDLLTLARGEAGRLELHPEPFEAGSLIEALVDSARELAADKNLELMAVLPDQPIFVVADCARIDQVLTNLVINSIRYTDEGQVRVKLLGYDPELRRLRFDVADTGPGIPDDALPSLLAPDRTLSSDERRGKGSGLGLAIVRTLVDLLGGEISVRSELGKGTSFTLAIPAEPVLSSDAEAPAEQRTNRVLVVDDREDVLTAISSVIDELGFDCDRASSAVVAANLLAARRYDTVLLDLDMPIKSGIEIAGEARRSQGPNARSRFIGMSASEARRGAAEPFDAILTKPLDQAALRQAVTAGNYLSRPSQPGLWSPDD
jgi:signal transduction histidine kinase/CheY-like chemotaxis protein